MKNAAELPLLIERNATGVRNTFSKSDISHLTSTPEGPTLNRRLETLINRGHLQRAMRGFFFTDKAALEDIAMKIYPRGYISLSNALAAHQVIGTIPSYHVRIITGKPRGKTIRTEKGSIVMSVNKLHAQAETVFADGRRMATAEQAFVDACVYHLRGESLPFNLFSDVATQKLERSAIDRILARYPNPKLVAFTRNVLNES